MPASAAVSFRAADSASTNTVSGGIVYVGAGTAAGRTGCGSINPSIPAGNVGDLLIALAMTKETGGGNDITMTGWNTYYTAEYPGSPPDENEMQVRIYWRFAQATNPNTITQSGSACDNGDGSGIGGQISRFRGVNATTPFDTATPGVVTQDSGNIDTGTITTPSANAMLLVASFVSDNRTVAEGAGWSESFDFDYNDSGAEPDLGISLNYELQTAAGSKSINNWDLFGGGSDENFGIILALRPAGTGGTPTLTINKPGGTISGDVMIASISTAPGTISITTPPAGWTVIRQVSQNNTNSSTLTSYYKVATATEPLSYDWVLSSTGFIGASGGIATFTGVDVTTPVDGESGVATGRDRDHDAPSVTTTLADGMLVTIHELASSGTWTSLDGMTEMVDTASETPTTDTGVSLGMYYEPRPLAGATGTRTARSTANGGDRDYGVTQSISLKPAIATPLVCFTDDFNRANGSPGSNWVVSNNNGTFGNPVIFNNRLRMTDASGNAATMATLQQIFPGAGNRIEVEFDHYAYGGSGADGIAVILSDFSVPPAPGGYGGSLGYAQRTGINGFTGGWLGVGIDEYGNFSNPTEGRIGGPGFRRDSVSIRGSGSGTSGYSYHAGTAANLVPEVDNNGAASPAHRYRIIIDHSNGVNAWVSVERDTTGSGSNYVTLVAAYDAKAQTGQAAVPANWILSYTGSTGGATNVHEIDSLRICATAQTPVNTTLHHIEFIHDASAVTCNPEQITIKACTNAACSSLVTSSVTATLSPTGWIGGDTKTFTGGTATYELKHTLAETITFATSSVVPAAANPVICRNAALTVIPCTMVFNDSGFIFSNDTDSSTIIPTQLSGKDSNVGFNAKTITLKAVKKSDSDPAQCEPAFQSKTLDIDFAAECKNPTSCVAGQQFILNGSALAATTNDNAAAGSSSYTTRSITFDATGKASIVFNYPEAGALELHARHNILLADGTTPSGNYMSGSSSFVVRPLGFSLSGLSYATDASGTVFTQAGEDFVTTLTAVRWQAADDTNDDGIPDTGANLANNITTTNFGNEITPITPSNITTSLPSVPLVTVIDAGILTNSANGTNFTNGVGTKTYNWSEVGIFNYSTTLSNYLSSGEDIIGRAQNVGRFTPHHFETLVTHACNSFTYSGQPFTVTALARNKANATTINYRNTFAKGVTLSDANPAATPLGTFANNTLDFASFSISPNFGQSTVTNLTYTFTTKETPPETIEIRATDITDTTISSNSFAEGSTEVRSGRTHIENAFGSELVDMFIPAQVEYYNTNGFEINTADTCSTIDVILTDIGADPITLGTGVGQTCIWDDADNSVGGTDFTCLADATKPQFSEPPTNGSFNINLKSPGANNTGDIGVTLTSPPWLQYDWDDNGTHDNDPTGT
ncbi:MAG: hypothetical protein OQK95_13240, partial [Gammaproteobacteria bacterium]|nr:hypothetical protein [Gammaproteobacteria bacterium]